MAERGCCGELPAIRPTDRAIKRIYNIHALERITYIGMESYIRTYKETTEKNVVIGSMGRCKQMDT